MKSQGIKPTKSQSKNNGLTDRVAGCTAIQLGKCALSARQLWLAHVLYLDEVRVSIRRPRWVHLDARYVH